MFMKVQMLDHFKIREVSQVSVARIERELGLPRFIAETLVVRGIDTPQAALRFLNPSFEMDWRDPYEMPGMSDVVDALECSLKARENIVVFGDFDLDGISATTVMTRGIRALGGKATPVIPKRFGEGYGLSMAAYERVKLLEPDLIITVDCGISCADEVEHILADGVKVVITDHHEAGDSVPKRVPLCDPKTSADNPSSILAGVGVALKVIQALGARMGYPYLWRSYTDFATLGTVADLMPMRDENRCLVKDGLERMNREPRACIAAMLANIAGEPKPLTSTNLSFSLIPRLNAAGRMGDADLALDLLMTDSFDVASELAAKLEEVNLQRRSIESELSDAATAQAKERYHGQRALVVSGKDWHEGVKGVVASRLVSQYGVPALLFTITDGEARGSGRSVGNVNLFKAVESLSDLLTRFGGHGAAVGVTLPADKLDEFTCRLCSYMDTLPEADFHPATDIDACVELGELSIENVDKISLLAPFGQEMTEPKYLTRHVVLEDRRAVGADKNHFSCKMTDGRTFINSIMFNCNDIEHLLFEESVVDVAYTLNVDEWRGRRSVKAVLDGLVPSRCDTIECDACSETLEFIDELYDGDPSARLDDRISASDPSGHDRAYWEELAQRDELALSKEIIRAIIGDNLPHAAQRDILNALYHGSSTLGIMATGRGKSLIFQVHAALIALRDHKASLFVYPLRALMADQAFHLTSQFERFGLRCAVLSGDCNAEERERIYNGIDSGEIDIVLTTPEYLSFHAARIARGGKIAFMVVDEAHHIGLSRAGVRPAYGDLGQVVEALGHPVVLAVTATASDPIFDSIKRVLSIKQSIIDRSSRRNLHLDDQRNIRNKEDYLAHIVADGGKCVIYVNSREQTMGVARRLRSRLPWLAQRIGFYNAGLRAVERKRIEELFRTGIIQVLVATSAFGEGIDIPDIRHVILYHMPFNEVEFNQMSGRAGRDGADAWVHLLYGTADVAINKHILSELSPDRATMADIYRAFRNLQKMHERTYFPIDADSPECLLHTKCSGVDPSAIRCAVSVFKELGLIDCKSTFVDHKQVTSIHVINDAAKVELTDSIRYIEGISEQLDFKEFCKWAMSCDAKGLIDRITHPIAPDDDMQKGASTDGAAGGER